ncbi:predicted protein [Naegleria gruberi]|uniref:Predicted protein n=1 Tax=Naegleria gruberi TaxID=5762 RepID=D2VBB1_NAEGR|nr:uncharacterized protein NAEGRDRAFT_66153 [Naegleria gruberi]EFC45765.1 predicted protein [Naegleria gruberi]|eukprot:XP_002678509.1 predicted protein [Naegleria gruberi strain NEG-M]
MPSSGSLFRTVKNNFCSNIAKQHYQGSRNILKKRSQGSDYYQSWRFYSTTTRTLSELNNNVQQENEIYVWGSIGEQSIPKPIRVFENNPEKNRVFFDGQKIVDVACGSEHVLFLSESGMLYALGGNQYGQCGKSPSSEQFVREPTRIKVVDESNQEMTFKSIFCGRDSNYAISSDGTSLCVFGLNDTAQLGLGFSKIGFSYVPRFVKLPKSNEDDQPRIMNVYCGSRHMFIRCKYEQSNVEKLFCWGGNQFGQLGLGHLFNQNDIVQMQLPTDLKVPETSISSGMSHTIAYSQSKAFSVGRGTEGQLGFTAKQAPMWREISDLSGLHIKHIISGVNHNMANVSSEKLGGEQIIGWGTNIFYGSQCTPEIIDIPSYGKFAPKNSIDLMTSGLFHSLLRVDGEKLYAIGNGQSFQLGQNERSNSESKLVQVLHPNVRGIRKIASGFSLNITIGE